MAKLKESSTPMTTTTIQISSGLLEELRNRKLYDRESYEEVIWDLIEDTKELSAETQNRIKVAEEEIRLGKIYSNEEIKKELNIDV